MIDKEKKEFGGWWIWVFGLIIIAMIALGSMRAGGLVFWTAVEREVFEQSYQHSAAQEAKFNTLNAELISTEARLNSGSLTDVQRADLEASALGLRTQINAMGN